MWHTKKYWINECNRLARNYDDISLKLENFKADVFEKKTIKDLQKEIVDLESSLENERIRTSLLRECNDTLTKALKK